MKNMHLWVVMAFICLSAGRSYAAAQEFNDLLYFEGIWDCEGKALDAATNTTKDVSSLYAVASMLGGQWLQATLFENSNNAAIQVASRFIGYDASWKRFVTYEAARDGAWSFLSTADSMWGTLDWSGYLHNFQGQLHQELEEAMRVLSDDAFTVVSRVKTASGWTTLYDGSCHRQGG